MLNTYEIDIVHSNDGLIHATLNLPTILNFKKFIWQMRSRDNSRRLSIYALFASKILSVSKFCKENIYSKYDLQKLINNGEVEKDLRVFNYLKEIKAKIDYR